MRKSQAHTEEFDTEVLVHDTSDSEDDVKPDNIDNKTRQREMRRGIDLATTLERIEKNFVITDPRLPDNPIVRIILQIISYCNNFLFKYNLSIHIRRNMGFVCLIVLTFGIFRYLPLTASWN